MDQKTSIWTAIKKWHGRIDWERSQCRRAKSNKGKILNKS